MMIRNVVAAVVLPLVMVLTGCAASEPEPEINASELLPCDWVAHPATVKFLDSSFRCLDGSDQVPAGFPAPSIVNVWGSWCPPCRDEIPFFVRLVNEHQVTVVGVDVDEPSIIAGQRFALRQAMPWPNVLDVVGASTAIFGPGVPVTWFIDADGVVVEKKIGVIRDYDELLELARKHGQL